MGLIFNEDGHILSTIDDRKQKGVGIVSHISSMLNSISLGFYYFEIAMVMREARLINGTLINSEVWPRLTIKQFDTMEAI